MKNLRKGFNLVEMLIVVVIIGILAAALLPRLQGAQASARDSARKSDISQLGAAFVSFINNRGYFPNCDGAENTTNDDSFCSANGKENKITATLKEVTDLSSMPQDPNKVNVFKLMGTEKANDVTKGQYSYAVMKKNSIPRGGMVLMARTETEGGSNWVTNDESVGVIWEGSYTDVSNIKPCTSFTKWTAPVIGTDGKCEYSDKAQLRYIYLF